MFVYKPVKTTALNKKHVAHKNWTVTDETAANYGVISYSGHYSRGEWSISDPNCTNIAQEALTGNSYYKREIFDSIYHLYYKDIENATKSGDSQYLSQQTRNLHDKVNVITIPSNIFGQRIKENSFTMSNASNTIYDDGVGNLRDTAIANLSNFKKFTKSDYIIKVDFNDGWLAQTTNPNVTYTYKTGSYHLQDISDGPLEPFATNVSFGRYASGNYGRKGSTFINFHGSMSIASASNSHVQIKNSRVLGVNEKRWNEDFAISMWVKIPLSQSMTSSYTGQWTPLETNIGEDSQRTLRDNTYNVIATSRQWSHNIPWELQVYNSKEASLKGKVRFVRGKRGSEGSIVSAGTYNNNNWNHIVVQVATGSMQLWVNGILEQQITDPVAEEWIYDRSTDIFIGARRWGYKTRKKSGVTQALVQGVSRLQATYKNKNKNWIYPFKGSVNEFRLFNRALTTPEISSLKGYYRDSDIVGNIFYNNGIAAITDLSDDYTALLNDYTIEFEGTTEHTIHNYQCVVEDEEYNVTFNPSARKNNDKNSAKMKGFATSSEFAPFITSIGLYNERNELLAIGKLSNPVQSPKDLDIVFNVQFDT